MALTLDQLMQRDASTLSDFEGKVVIAQLEARLWRNTTESRSILQAIDDVQHRAEEPSYSGSSETEGPLTSVAASLKALLHPLHSPDSLHCDPLETASFMRGKNAMSHALLYLTDRRRNALTLPQYEDLVGFADRRYPIQVLREGRLFLAFKKIVDDDKIPIDEAVRNRVESDFDRFTYRTIR